MRLYLSSFRFGNHPQRLVDLAGSGRRVATINNACDSFSPNDRKERDGLEMAALGALGFSVEEIDLRDYFGRPGQTNELDKLLAHYALVWVRGGNTFVLRRAMRLSGFDEILRKALERDAIVYGGYSAGVCVLAPSLRGLELADDPNTLPPMYQGETIWEGLSVLPYAIAPHYRSDHPESSAMEGLVQYYIDHHMLFRALRDGQVIVVRENREELLP